MTNGNTENERRKNDPASYACPECGAKKDWTELYCQQCHSKLYPTGVHDRVQLMRVFASAPRDTMVFWSGEIFLKQGDGMWEELTQRDYQAEWLMGDRMLAQRLSDDAGRWKTRRAIRMTLPGETHQIVIGAGLEDENERSNKT